MKSVTKTSVVRADPEIKERSRGVGRIRTSNQAKPHGFHLCLGGGGGKDKAVFAFASAPLWLRNHAVTHPA